MEESQRSGITCTIPQVQVDRFILKSALEDCLEDLEELRQLPDVSSDVGQNSCAQPEGPAVSEVGPASVNFIILALVSCLGSGWGP